MELYVHNQVLKNDDTIRQGEETGQVKTKPYSKVQVTICIHQRFQQQ